MKEATFTIRNGRAARTRRTSVALSRPFCLLLAALAAPTGCRPESDAASAPSPRIAASSSYVAVAVRDVLGGEELVLVLAEPGMCPGHFDLRPSQVRQLRGSQLLLRFNFQQSLDRRIRTGSEQGPLVVAVEVPGGMCEPASYSAVCQQIAEALVSQGRITREEADAILSKLAARMDELTAWMAGELQAAGLEGAPVLASGHQAAFCTSLGLKVVAKFSGADTAQPSQIDQAIKAGEGARVRLVVANRPEGRQLADALAERLGARVVVFDNFPTSNNAGAFDKLLRSNIRLLIEAHSR
ncbi:MAG: zinc ABC transporter substrate-binding protein [Planctomycetes bacterium]|nr:zinc ABC transporter substrate-binding protein [Planctomycetota bacterium]